MIGDSRLAHLGLSTSISALSLVVPVAFLHHLLDWLNISPLATVLCGEPMTTVKYHIFYCIHAWLAIELVFYGYFLYVRARLQRPSAYIQLTTAERDQLFKRCLAEIGDLDVFLSGWFHKEFNEQQQATEEPCRLQDLYRDNIREWLAWAFYGLTLEQVQHDATINRQLDNMLNQVEQHKSHRFLPGYNSSVSCLRLNVEPFSAKHRPLLFYVAVLAMDAVAKLILRAAGFRPYGRPARGITGFFRSLIDNIREGDIHADMTLRGDRTLEVSYWYRPAAKEISTTTATTTRIRHTSRSSNNVQSSTHTPCPIMFIHGLGMGLLSYLAFVAKIWYAGGARDVPVYLLDMPYLGMRLLAQAPSIPETAKAVKAALHRHGHRRAVFIGHSFGSAVVAGLCRAIPKAVAGVVLVDPICFLLLEAAVAWRFVRRVPVRANERFIEFFVSRELFTSYFISRQFHWYHAILWADELPSNGATAVYLSEADLLVPSAQVAAYLKRCNVPYQMMPGDHAQFLFNPRWENEIISQALTFARAETLATTHS
ncbi:Alpha/Beta hydrolase protein [Syncephalis plumigaleata]|nr:Alpha/Beta hydrolase protein [Syncephalis plumigaleata]